MLLKKDFKQVMSLTEENAIELHGVGVVPYTCDDGRGENIQTLSKNYFPPLPDLLIFITSLNSN
jgi:hypothetical protein